MLLVSVCLTMLDAVGQCMPYYVGCCWSVYALLWWVLLFVNGMCVYINVLNDINVIYNILKTANDHWVQVWATCPPG